MARVLTMPKTRKKTSARSSTRSAEGAIERVRRKGKVESSKSVVDDRTELLKLWGSDPLKWLHGVDPTSPTDEFPHGVPLIWTKDEGKKGADAVAPWPASKTYPALDRFIHEFYYADEPLVLVDKCRQVMATWATILTIDWECRFVPVRRWLLSKTKEKEAIAILNDKPRFVHERLPLWVQQTLPVKMRPQEQNFYGATESVLKAVTENVADSEARGSTCSGVLIDEAAFQRRLPDIIGAALPMAVRIIAITTANVGNQGAKYFHDLCIEGLDERLM